MTRELKKIKMPEVLLFNQYFSSPKDSSEIILATMPINLLALASYMKTKGIECRIYELGGFDLEQAAIEGLRFRCGLSDEEITEIIKKENPRIIGLGCLYSMHYIDVLAIARLIKKVNPTIKVVLGGNHATIFAESILKDDALDFVVMGEGELTFFELCKAIFSENPNFNSINGLAFKDNRRNVLVNSQRELIANLDTLPQMDYSLLDVRKYAQRNKRNPYLMRSPVLGIVTSRGCPGKCVFCTVKAVWGRTWRGRSAKKTVDEIALLYNNYGIREFSFLDDSASLNKKRWLDICEEIISRKLNIRWTTPNGIAHWTLNKPILKKMKQSGCYRITFGIESGSQETRLFIGKDSSLSQAREMIQYANRIGMWTICTNIIGFPYETRAAVDDTIKFVKQSGADFATFYLLSPHMTSDVYSYFEREGLIDFSSIFKENKLDEAQYEAMYKILNEGGLATKYFTRDQLRKIQVEAYRSFIIRRVATYLTLIPLLRKIHSLEDARYVLRLLFNGLKIVLKSFTMKSTKDLLYN